MATTTRQLDQAPGDSEPAPLVAEGIQPGRYDATIRRMQQVLERKRSERLNTSEQWMIDILDPEISNLEEAIDLFTEANRMEMPKKPVQFGGDKFRTLTVPIPPHSKEFRFKPISFQRYIYATKEPVEIVLLRRMVADQERYHHLREMALGLQAAVLKDTGKVVGFYPEEYVRDLFNAGALQSQIG